MYFFVDDGVAGANSGVETAILTRMALFKKLGQASRFIAMEWFAALHFEAQRLGLAQDEILSIYDWFMDAVDYPLGKLTLAEIEAPQGLVEKNSDDVFRRFYDDRDELRYEVRNRGVGETLFRGTWFGEDGTVLQQDRYDIRGFKGMVETFQKQGDQNVLISKDFYSPAGEQKMHLVVSHERGDYETYSLVQLFDYKGATYQFPSGAEFYRFFFDELNLAYGNNNAFIVDRGLRFAWPAQHMQSRAFVSMILHSPHIHDLDRPAGLLVYHYQYEFDNLAAFQTAIVPTRGQLAQVVERWPAYRGFRLIPVGIIDQATMDRPHRGVAERKRHEIVTISRLDPYKRIDHIINAMPAVLTAIPDAHLSIFGLGPHEGDLRERIETLGLTDAVSLRGLTQQPLTEFEQSAVMVAAAHAEGFGLTTMEATSMGTPAIAFDVPYGPQAIIDEGVNGHRVPLQETDEANEAALAEAIIDVIGDDERLAGFIERTYANRARFSEATVGKLWQGWIDEVEDWRDETTTR
jgi:poly(glycerol-phosphate) alpha-glucosyltransferase